VIRRIFVQAILILAQFGQKSTAVICEPLPTYRTVKQKTTPGKMNDWLTHSEKHISSTAILHSSCTFLLHINVKVNVSGFL